MMGARHTPGPWLIEPINDGLTFQITTPEDAGFKVICETDWGDPDDEANARLIAAAPDHALIGWAMCVQDATWEEWATGAGEFCFAGLRYTTGLDEFGCPVLTVALRAALTSARGGA